MVPVKARQQGRLRPAAAEHVVLLHLLLAVMVVMVGVLSGLVRVMMDREGKVAMVGVVLAATNREVLRWQEGQGRGRGWGRGRRA